MTTPARRLFALLLWLPGLVLVGTGLTLLTAGPAAAATGSLGEIEREGDALSFVLSAQDLPSDTSILVDSVAVSLQGQSVEETAVGVDETNAPIRRVVLTIDISGSMAEEGRLDAAKSAANAFLDIVNDDVEVALVVFNQSVTRSVELTKDHEQVRQAVNALEAGGDTALYEAVITSLNVLGPDGLRSLVLLSDGENDAPSVPTSLADASAAVQNAQNGGLDVTIVAIAPEPDFLPALDQLKTAAGPSRGRVIQADELDTITESFQQAAATINEQVLVTAPLPPGVTSGEIVIDVSATLSDGSPMQVQETYFLEAAATTAEPTAPPDYGPKPVALPSYPIGQEILPVALVAIFAGAATILAVALMAAVRTDTAHGRISRRLSLYTLTGRQPQKQAETTSTSVFGSSAIARSAVELAGRVVAGPRIESALATRLDNAGLLLKPAEWTLIQISSGLFGGLLLLLLSGGSILAALLGLVLGVVGPQFYLLFQRSRREDAFLTQLPETLQLMAGSLSVGYSLSQAVDTVVREGSQPVSGEFSRALVQARLGMPVEDALEAVAARFRSKDMTWAVMAIRIQREVGGNLAEVLSKVAGTLRERERLHRQVRVLSAEGRLSAWILGALPVVFTLYLVLVRPEYLRPLHTTPLGWLLIIVGCVLFLAGVLWLRKVIKVQV